MKVKKIPDEILEKMEKLLNLDVPVDININKNHLGTINFTFTEKCQLKNEC